MRSTNVPELDVARVLADYGRRVEAVCADDQALALRTVRRLTPANWTLEWYLPWWLGHAFGLDSAVSEEIVLSNVFGLVSIRLQDDLLDAEVGPEDLAGARHLSVALFDEAVAIYRRRIGGASPFWVFLESVMSDWHRASAGDGARRAADLPSRGAPLKIAAFAACLLAGREDRWEALERCLDHALAALVRYDQVCDWEDDLRAGRWNAFVAAVSPGPQGSEERDRNRSTMLVAMMTGGVVATEFRRIHAEAVRGARLAATLGSPPLSAYLSRYAARTAEQGAMLEAHYRGAADRATTLMFGSAGRHAT